MIVVPQEFADDNLSLDIPWSRTIGSVRREKEWSAQSGFQFWSERRRTDLL
jgi:hypothetical protein